MVCTHTHQRDNGREVEKRFVREMNDPLPTGERHNCIYSRREIMNPVPEACRRRGYVDQVLQDWKD
ncbi:MAG: hypothetical protein ACE5QW_09345 [Thermoplasmata archaeon]